MTRAELLALAERVEKSEGADRELDRAISRGLANTNDIEAMICAELSEDRFTASLDAAASLVPEGWGRVTIYLPAYALGCLIGDARCELHNNACSGGGPFVQGIASGEHAEARARTAAALRARAEEAEG